MMLMTLFQPGNTKNESGAITAPSAFMWCSAIVIAMVLFSLVLSPAMGCRNQASSDDEDEEAAEEECEFDAEDYMDLAVDSLHALSDAEEMYYRDNGAYGTYSYVTCYIRPDSHIHDLEGYYTLDLKVGGSYSINTNASQSYTVIAYPERDKRRFLKTFAMLDDAIVRVYNPDNRNVLNHICSWDPIL